MAVNLVALTTLLLLLTAKVTATTYQVVNVVPGTPAGAKFDREVGSDYILNTLPSATDLIWQTFRQNSSDCKPGVDKVRVFIAPFDGSFYVENSEIHISTVYISEYPWDLKRKVTGIVYNAMTQIWQWTANGHAPKHVLEGISDYVKINAGYADEHSRMKPGFGYRWDQGGEITAYFFDFCESLRNGFVAELNAKMKGAYNDSYFKDMLGKSVERVWDDYKDKYYHEFGYTIDYDWYSICMLIYKVGNHVII